jgi:hypothetical protein
MRGSIIMSQSVQEPGGIKQISWAAPTMIVHADNFPARGIGIAPRIRREPAFWPGKALERPYRVSISRA